MTQHRLTLTNDPTKGRRRPVTKAEILCVCPHAPPPGLRWFWWFVPTAPETKDTAFLPSQVHLSSCPLRSWLGARLPLGWARVCGGCTSTCGRRPHVTGCSARCLTRGLGSRGQTLPPAASSRLHLPAHFPLGVLSSLNRFGSGGCPTRSWVLFFWPIRKGFGR